jgi:2-polyprenyl-3-methyl-5-hydroxy-6-metoxy-1,4-benzoquinol methylase
MSNSVRNSEVEFYSKIDDWWSVDGPQKQLHKFNRVRVNFIRELVNSELLKANILCNQMG